MHSMARQTRHGMSDGTTELTGLMRAARIPGIAIAMIRDGKLDRFECQGVRLAGGSAVVTENTVFDAASLSKPVFALIALQLADQGLFELDAPLCGYLPGYIEDDEQGRSITARHVLCHSPGLPNWRGPRFSLRTYFQPGERFSYSGEGYLYLQKVVETITGESLDRVARRLVFEPLDMANSSFVWRSRFNANRAHPHDEFGRPALSHKPGEANAAASLQTTAADYSRFLLTVLSGQLLKPETARIWLQPQMPVTHRGHQALEPTVAAEETGISWGLGWGLEPAASTFFHWGDNGTYKAFVVGSIQAGAAFVAFTNGASGLSIMPELVADFFPREYRGFSWLGYERHDSPRRRLLNAMLAGTIRAASEAAIDDLSSDDLLWLARGLEAAGRLEDGALLRRRARKD